ncbi:MAG: rhomboid family intramembrane serine protease [Thermomicrobiales bacterium]
MFPLSDDNTGQKTTPFVTWALIGINIAVFIYQYSLGAAMMPFVLTWGLQPYDLIHFRDVPALFTSMFLHGGIIHLVGNMFYLHVFGDNLEDVMGHARFLIFYILCGLAAAAAQVMSDPMSQVPVIGASGAIAGVLGGYILLFPGASIRVAMFGFLIRTLPAWIVLGFWFALNALNAYATLGDSGGGIAFMAHVGGFIGGVVLVRLFVDRASLDRQRRIRAEHRAMELSRRRQSPY